MAHEVQLPKTNTPPDNLYFNSKVVSWNFTAGGNKATLGFIQPGFQEQFPVADGGEHITLVKPEEGTILSIDELDEAGEATQTHVLHEDGQEVFIPGGKNMKVSTAGKVIEYICVYPEQPANE